MRSPVRRASVGPSTRPARASWENAEPAEVGRAELMDVETNVRRIPVIDSHVAPSDHPRAGMYPWRSPGRDRTPRPPGGCRPDSAEQPSARHVENPHPHAIRDRLLDPSGSPTAAGKTELGRCSTIPPSQRGRCRKVAPQGLLSGGRSACMAPTATRLAARPPSHFSCWR